MFSIETVINDKEFVSLKETEDNTPKIVVYSFPMPA